MHTEGYRERAKLRTLRAGVVLAVALLCVCALRLAWGEWDIPISRVMAALFPSLGTADPHEALVVRSVRLPRVLAAVGVGGMLSMSGVVLQGLLTNPLAEPYTLGIAAGAAFGGAIGFMFDSFAVQPAAFAGAVCSLWMVSAIAKRGGGGGAMLVLSGIVANAFLSAGVAFMKAISDDKLGAIVLWLMGSMSGASAFSAAVSWGACAFVFVPAFIYGPQLDAVSLGGGRGAYLGVDERKLRLILLYTASFGTAAAVSYFGIIGFVGLVVPHLIRIMAGPAHRPLLVLSFLGGGVLLAAADGIAQRLGELPVGVVTSLIGGPFFCWLLMTRKARA